MNIDNHAQPLISKTSVSPSSSLDSVRLEETKSLGETEA